MEISPSGGDSRLKEKSPVTASSQRERSIGNIKCSVLFNPLEDSSVNSSAPQIQSVRDVHGPRQPQNGSDMQLSPLGPERLQGSNRATDAKIEDAIGPSKATAKHTSNAHKYTPKLDMQTGLQAS